MSTMGLIAIKGTNDLYRDTGNMALISKDITGAEEYRIKRKIAESQAQQINNLKTEIDNIKDDISDIKKMIVKLLEKG